MTLPLPADFIDLLDLELIDPSQSQYGFKGYYPVLDTHLMWYNENTDEWNLAEKIKVSKNLYGWYYYGSIPIIRDAAITQHLINLKRQINDAVLSM